MTAGMLQLLVLIIIANSAPILIRVMFHDRWNFPVDFRMRLPDGFRLFGSAKTWRGMVSAMLVTPPAAWILGLAPETGLYVAAYALLGDLFSSFIKRRMGMAASSMAPVIDQVPESLLPAWMMMTTFQLDFSDVIPLVLIFIMIELVLSRIFFMIGIRKHPY